PICPAETNMLPLIVNRDYRGNNRSLIDHNGYRMGQVSEIDENWKLGGTRTTRFSSVPVDFGPTAPPPGTQSNGTDYNITNTAANTVIGPLPVGATITSLLVQYARTDGIVFYNFIDLAQLFPFVIAMQTISTGTDLATTDLAV